MKGGRREGRKKEDEGRKKGMREDHERRKN
jgi:hypothetical protein